jgi:hypothetical protein
MEEHMAKIASWLLIIGGVVLIAAGVTTYAVVSSQLADEQIVTTSDACLPDRDVTGPFTAYCMADIIDQHTREITGGQTYAELDREDPLRNTAMQSSFLRSSLFTSVLAFGVSALVVGTGVLAILGGVGLRQVLSKLEKAGV